MKRADVEHILRASKGTTGEEHFIIIGSQSVLGKHPDAPRELRHSMELDIYPRRNTCWQTPFDSEAVKIGE